MHESFSWRFAISRVFAQPILLDEGRDVARLFGLTDASHRRIYEDFSFSLSPGQIGAVVGPSGSGKSVLLREVARQTPGAMVLCGRSRSNRSVAAQLRGGSLKSRLEVLAACGLAEAKLLAGPVGALSEGQRYRLGLARALHRAARSGAPALLLADEFGGSLDIMSAVILARRLRKVVSRGRLGLLLATHRTELLRALRPDVVIIRPPDGPPRITKRWRSSAAPTPLPEPHHWPICPGRLADYAALGDYHYLSGPPGIVKRLYRINTPRRWVRRGAPPVAAVATVSPPMLFCRGRNVVFPDRYTASNAHRRRAVAKLNREVECISRVIVHPLFRGSGLAVRLVKHILDASPAPVVEAMAVMGKIHPFFIRGGMRPAGLFRGKTQDYHYYLHIKQEGGNRLFCEPRQ